MKQNRDMFYSNYQSGKVQMPFNGYGMPGGYNMNQNYEAFGPNAGEFSSELENRVSRIERQIRKLDERLRRLEVTNNDNIESTDNDMYMI